MHKPKTLVILSPAFPENESASYWVPSQQLMVKALQRNYPGIKIIVLALLYPYQSSNYQWHNIQVISFDGAHKRKLRRLLHWRNVWRSLKQINAAHEVIGIFSFWCTESALIGKFFAKRHSLKHYCWICGQDARKTNTWIKFIRPRADELVAMSYFLAEEFERNHRVRPRYIINNAVDPPTFPRINSMGRDIDVLAAGSLIPLKQYDLFVEIIGSLKQIFPGIKAFHCGIGEEKEKLEGLIKKWGLEKNLELLGGKKHEEVLELMQRTKVFLHTSSYEGVGAVCLEALYAGAHVISFCYPLEKPAVHWHVVKTTEEMTAKAREILSDINTDYSPVLLYSMDDSAKEVMSLFEN